MWSTPRVHFGPLLFLIYINDILYSSEVLSFILFADDTNIFYKHKDIEVAVSIVNNELSKVSDWLSANKLSLNISKTNCIIFHPYQKNEIQVDLFIADNKLQYVDDTKKIGVNRQKFVMELPYTNCY